MEKTEEWKSLDFLGYPDYEVSNLGRVKSLARTIIRKNGRRQTFSERILKQGKNRYGYLHVVLSKNGVTKNFTVHKLVTLAYISNPYNLPQINHKDENKENNKLENLEWCTHQYNNNYGTIKERKSKKILGVNNPMYGKHHTEEAKQKMRKPIQQFTKEGVFIRDWDSATTVSKELKIGKAGISKCCKSKLKTAYGYIWRYKE